MGFDERAKRGGGVKRTLVVTHLSIHVCGFPSYVWEIEKYPLVFLPTSSYGAFHTAFLLHIYSKFDHSAALCYGLDV